MRLTGEAGYLVCVQNVPALLSVRACALMWTWPVRGLH